MGEAFRSLIQRRLFPALGLKHSFIVVPTSKLAHYAWGYTEEGKPIRMVRGMLSDETYGIKTTAGDMIHFIQENIDPFGLDSTIRKAITKTHTGYFQAGPMTQDLIWEQYPVALSALLDGNSYRMILKPTSVSAIVPPQAPQQRAWLNKTGSTNGFGAYVAFIPSKQLGIVLLANKNYPIPDRVRAAYQILSALALIAQAPPAKPTIVLQRVAVLGTDRELGMGFLPSRDKWPPARKSATSSKGKSPSRLRESRRRTTPLVSRLSCRPTSFTLRLPAQMVPQSSQAGCIRRAKRSTCRCPFENHALESSGANASVEVYATDYRTSNQRRSSFFSSSGMTCFSTAASTARSSQSALATR